MGTPYAYFQKSIVPLAEAKLGVRTHAFNYGTAVFEGIRGNWNADDGELYLFRVREHYQRLRKSCRILRIDLPYSDDELCELTQQVVAKCGYAEDVYVRPLAYKSGEVIGPRVNDVDSDFLIYVIPLGAYLDADAGIRCCTSTWRRVDDTSIPARAKVTGIYVNSSLAKTEALENGFDEAIMLNADGHVSEGSGENIFLVRDGKLITPPVSDNVLEGITRDAVARLAAEELGVPTIERQIDRSELYICDECFMTGTAAHVSPVIEVDRRPVGEGSVGPITAQLQKLYFAAIQGRLPKYRDWVTPVAAGALAENVASRP